MKSKKNILLIASIIVLSLLLLTACTAEAPSPAEAESAVKVPAAAVEQEQPQEEAKEAKAAPPQEQPAAAAPEDPEPAEQEKLPQPAACNTPAPTEAKQENKTALKIEGSGVEKPVTLSLDELKTMKDAFFEDDFFSLNSYGTKEYFHFKGIKLNAILQKAGVKSSAATIIFVASDGYKLELSMEQALKDDYIDEQDPAKKYPVIIAWNENGKDYDTAKGYPFRLVMGQKEPGDVNKPQWVMNIATITVN